MLFRSLKNGNKSNQARSTAVHSKPSYLSVPVTATKSIMRPSLVNDANAANKMEKATGNDSLNKMPTKSKSTLAIDQQHQQIPRKTTKLPISTTLNATFPSKLQTLPKTSNTNEKAVKDRLMPNTLMTIQRKNVANNNLTLPTPSKAHHPTTQR